mgnify:FL=1|tara:strand:- start:406 stop:600 length:195 start_codon:yes stop_codon:yes gene_type:complete
MITVKLKQDEVKIIRYALELAYTSLDGSPVLRPVNYNHRNFEKNLMIDLEVARGVEDKLMGWDK